MKILHIIPSYYPAIKFGGPIQSVHLLNRTLAKEGITVDVLTTTAGNCKKNMAVWLNDCKKDDGWCCFDGLKVNNINFV